MYGMKRVLYKHGIIIIIMGNTFLSYTAILLGLYGKNEKHV